ncbi:MAG: ACT domain-containing protein [candidate division WOR-3 bacterium]|nr:MAG: ACT domain-containing protein [candidate division WOR-3 bacterium]
MIESIEHNKNVAKVTLQGVSDRYGVAAEIFSALGEHGLNVELISTSSTGHGRADISFAILESDLDEVVKLLETIKGNFGGRTIAVDKDRALITIYGTRLATTPGVAGRIFKVLSENGINIDMISASLSVLSIVVGEDRVTNAVEALREAFPK